VRRRLEGWSTSGGRGDDGAIVSLQRLRAAAAVVEPSEPGGRRLGARYWRQIPRSTAGLVRTRETDAGVELRVLGGRPLLLRLGPPRVTVADGRVECSYPILGGLLVRRSGGAIALWQDAGPPAELGAAVTGYFPRLTGLLYRLVQRPVHVALVRRYLARLAAEARR
jgi:hypothetical protein